MFHDLTRRRFVTTAAGLAFLETLPIAQAAAPHVPRQVQLASEIEPLARLIEETPRANLMERIVGQIRKGTSYQELLSAVFLAGVRSIQPRPVGFKFHAVLVINSAHLASLASSDQDRWLPLLWSVDYFKSSQARNKAEGDWKMSPVEESKLPEPHKARQCFLDAMAGWDVEAADVAITAWGRSASAGEVFEAFWLLGARDFRDIGHKAIYVANAWRTLQTIGWKHREPVLRSLAYALLDHEGGNPAKRNDFRDQPGRDNLVRATRYPDFRHAGKLDPTASTELLHALRTLSPDDASKLVADMLDRGVHPASIWDGLFLTGGELLMRQPGIVGLHTLTTTNALHYAYETASVPGTRAFLLLQAAAFLALFQRTMRERGKLASEELDRLTPAECKHVEEIFADVSRDRLLAARKTRTLLEKSPELLLPISREARHLVFAKGTDSHDYKFSSAVLEDASVMAPSLRPAFVAASMFHLRGAGDRENELISRVRGALKG